MTRLRPTSVFLSSVVVLLLRGCSWPRRVRFRNGHRQDGAQCKGRCDGNVATNATIATTARAMAQICRLVTEVEAKKENFKLSKRQA
jgi:hypothetical protein